MIDYQGNNYSNASPLIVQLKDTGGSADLTSDFSAVADDATFAPGALINFNLTQLQIILAWTNPLATTAFDFNKFGSLAALTNGLVFSVTRSGRVDSFFVNDVTQNNQFSNCRIMQTTLGMCLQADIPIAEPITLNGNNGDVITCHLNDDFSVLDTFVINAIGSQGYSF